MFVNVPGKVLAIFEEKTHLIDTNDEPRKLTILLHSCHDLQQKENILTLQEKMKQMKMNAISECWQLECEKDTT